MRKKVIVTFLVLILLSVGLYAWVNRVNYEISDTISDVEVKPMDGVSFTIEANGKEGRLQIENNSSHYIVIDLSRKPIDIEIQKEDGWHRLSAHNIVSAEAYAIAEGTTYALDFDWRNFVDGPLKAGTYRAILYFGDGTVEPYDAYSIVTEFRVD